MSDNPSTILEMTTDYKQETLIPNNAPPNIPSQHIYKNLLLIDSRVREYNHIITSTNNDTTCIVFDYAVETMNTLKTKIAALSMDVIVAVGIVQDNYISPNYQWLSSMQPALLQDIETIDASLNSWTDVKDFCSFLKNDKGTLFYDLLACNTYSNPDWVYALDQLETACGMEFRASNDTTGWGGNWILESDNVDLTTIYFTPLILQWQNTLSVSIPENSTFYVDQTTFDVNISSFYVGSGATIIFKEDVTINGAGQYFIFTGPAITIDGRGFTITLSINIGTGWRGLVQNGQNGSNGYGGCTIKNITIKSNNPTGSLAPSSGYLTWDYFNMDDFNNYFNLTDFNKNHYNHSSSKCFINNCSNYGVINAEWCGGLFGSGAATESLVEATDCYNYGDIIGAYSGGIFAGSAGHGTYGHAYATNCYNTGVIKGSYSGGIFGHKAGIYSGDAKATNCYNSGTLHADAYYIGGIFGNQSGGEYGSATATNCYNCGIINCQYGGGIFGYQAGNKYGHAYAVTCANSGTINGPGCGGIYGEWAGYNSGYASCTGCTNAATFANNGLNGDFFTINTGGKYYDGVYFGPLGTNIVLAAVPAGWNSTIANRALTGRNNGTSNIWLDMNDGTNYLLIYNCTTSLLLKYGSITAATNAFRALSGYSATPPTITSKVGSSGAYTITFNSATCAINVITAYKYATSDDGINFTPWVLISQSLSGNSSAIITSFNIPTTKSYVKLVAVDAVDGPSSIAYPLTDITLSGIIYRVIDNNNAYIIGYSNLISSTITIPNSVTIASAPYTITDIIEAKFTNCLALNSVIITSTILTSISDDAFSGCANMTTLTLPSNGVIATIAFRAFAGCTSLSSVTFPRSLTSIGASAFSGCNSVTFISVSLPTGLTTIGDYAFYNCNKVISLTLPESGLTTIGINAFYNCPLTGSAITIRLTGTSYIGAAAFQGCSGLSTCTFSTTTGLTTIPSTLFGGCSAMTSLILPVSGVTTIGEYACFNCTSLGSVTLPTSLTTIGSHAFYNCSSGGFISVTLPASLTTLGANAFQKCTYLTNLTLPANTGITIINSYVFAECSLSNSSIYIPSSVTYIASTAFIGSTGPKSVIFSTTNLSTIPASLFQNCTAMTSLTLPVSGLTTIDNNAFQNCPLTGSSITITLTGASSIGTSAFEGCTGLLSVTFSRTGLAIIPESLFNGCSSLTSLTLPVSGLITIAANACSDCISLGSVTFPTSLTTIGASAFYNCSSGGFISVALPGSLTTLGESAFQGCSNMTSLTLPTTPSFTTIGANAFNGCPLTNSNIIIPNGVVLIGVSAFQGCTGLLSATFTTTNLSTIPDSLFSGCISLTTLALPPSGLTTIGADAFNGCPLTNSSIIIPNEVVLIGDGAFQGCSGLLSVTFNTTKLTSIHSYTFYSCISLTTIILPPSGLISIRDFVFTYCASLNYIVLPNYLTSVGDYVFAYCTKLISVTLPIYTTSVTTLGIGMFEDCITLSSIIIPNGYTNIPDDLCNGCTNLLSVTLPNSITSIGDNAFSNCSSLSAVTIPSSVTSIGDSAFYSCISLSSVIFSTNNVLNSIGVSAFSGCKSLTAINFTNITTSSWTIYLSAFACINLKCVVFGTSLPAINSSVSKATFTATYNAAYKPTATPLTNVSNPNLFKNFYYVIDISENSTAPSITGVTSTSYGSASITFTPGNSPKPPITNYKYSIDDGNTWILCCPAILTEDTITPTPTSFTISGLSSGTTYSVSIKATNFIRDSPASIDSSASVFTTTKSTIGPFSTIGTNSILGINNISNLSVNTNCLAFHAPMGVYFTNPNLYAPTSQYFNFNSNKGFTFNSGTTRLVTIDNVGSLWCNGLNVVGSGGGGGGGGGGGNITCESNMFVLGKVLSSQLQLSNSSTIVSIRCINFNVGASIYSLKTGNIVTYGNTYVDSTKLFFTITFNNNNGNVQINNSFSTNIDSVTTTSMIFHVKRTDTNDSWTNNLIAQIIITEIA